MTIQQGWGMPEMVFPSYGYLLEDSSGTNLVLTDLGVWYKWIASTVGQTKGNPFVSASASSDDLTINDNGAGVYVVSLAASFGGSNSSNMHGGVGIDGTPVHMFHRKLGGADIGSASGTAIMNLAVGNVLTVMFSSDTDSTTVSTQHVHLAIYRISR